jgi:serine protease Do
VKLTLWRDGHEATVDVAIGTQAPEKTAERGGKAGSEPSVGMALAEITPALRQQFGLDDSAKGIVVAGVEPESRATQSGVQAGDVILRVGNHAVTTPQQVGADVNAAERADKSSVPLLISRNGSPYHLALQLANG